MMQLPSDWRERATPLPDDHPQAKEYTRWYQEYGLRVWCEDDCPLQAGLVVVEKDSTGKITVFLVSEKGQAVIMPRLWN